MSLRCPKALAVLDFAGWTLEVASDLSAVLHKKFLISSKAGQSTKHHSLMIISRSRPEKVPPV
jgi:hypothetical protein